jgi:subtilisin
MRNATFRQNCPCCFVVPLRFLERLAASQDVNVAAAAARTIRLSTSMGAFRAQLSTGAPPAAAAKRTGLRRQVFTCAGSEDLPGDPVRMETDGGGVDASADEAFNHSGTTWKFFNQVFGRESVDGNGKTLVSSVHYGQGYQNAFWNGQQMVYGDGDGKVFVHFTGSLEVIAHELTHGVTGFSAQLPYQGQPGALNESMSDVFGSLVKQWALGQTEDQADWLIGAGVIGPGLKGRALRDMANPGTAFEGDEQPGHMKDYVDTDDDHGGVHINSGIPNKAFVLATRAIGGRAWEILGKVWYTTLTERLTSAADFRKCANETISVARDVYPNDASIAQKIAAAWVNVGVLDAVPASVGPLIAVGALAIPAALAAASLSAGGNSAIDQQIAGLGHAKVLVVLRTDTSVMQLAATTAADPGASAEAIRRDIEGFFIEPDEQQYAALAAANVGTKKGRGIATRAAEPPPRVRIFPRLGLAIGVVDANGLGSLRAHPRVKDVHAAPALSLIKPVDVSPARSPAAPTWGLQRLNVPQLWAKGITGKGIVVGHLDTGVDGSHPALAGAIAAFAEFDMTGSQVPGARPRDSAEHGTHTAGTIVGRTNARGAFGVAPGARLASALAIEGGQVIDRVVAGLEWIVGQNVPILSMSVGLRGYVPAFEEVIAALRRNNVLPVIAAGNEGPDTSRSPGNYDDSLSVGACTEQNLVADFSSSQRFARALDPLVPDLVAPGVGVLSSVPDGKFAMMDGTSMATPHVAGLAALLLQAKPDATMAQLEAAILDSCRLPATMPDYRANRGVPDALRALVLLTGQGPEMAASPAVALRARSAPPKRKAGRRRVA